MEVIRAQALVWIRSLFCRDSSYPRVATPWYQLTIESIGDPYRLGHDAGAVRQDMWRFAWRSSSVFPWVRGGWRWLCRCRGLFSRGSSPSSPGLLWEVLGGRAIGRKGASLMRLKFHSRAWQTLGQILIPLQRTETYRSWMPSFPNRNSYINIWTWLNKCFKQTDSEHIVFFGYSTVTLSSWFLAPASFFEVLLLHRWAFPLQGELWMISSVISYHPWSGNRSQQDDDMIPGFGNSYE